MRRGLHRMCLLLLACGCAAGAGATADVATDASADVAQADLVAVDAVVEAAQDAGPEIATGDAVGTDLPGIDTPAEATASVTTCRDCHLHLAKLIASVEAEPPPVEVGEQGKGEC